MENITLSKPTYYRAGVAGASAVIGHESGVCRVARYSFRSPLQGASQVELTLTGLTFTPGIGGTRPTAFRFFLGTDPVSHANAGPDTPCTGLVEGDGENFSATVQAVLLPDTEYYLFLFPNTTAMGWLSMELATVQLTLSGGSTSQPSLEGEAVLGTELTIYTNPYVSRFTHRLTLRMGEEEWVLGEGVGESLAWTPPMELALSIPGVRQAATLSCTTFDGGVELGSTQTPLVLTVPEWVVPTVSATWQDTSPAQAAVGELVKLISTLEVEVTAQGAWGSTVTAAELFLQDKAYYGGILMESGDVKLTVTVTDSRGRSASAEYPLTVLDYAVPQLSLHASRCQADGTADDTGEFALVTLSGGISDLQGKNRGLLILGEEEIALEAGAFTEKRILSAPSEQTLTIEAQLSDLLTSASRSMVLSVGYATLDFLRGGRGIAFGTTATEPGFTCAMPARFTGGLFAGSAELFPAHLPDTEYLTPHFFLGKPVYARVVTVPAGFAELYHGIPMEYPLSLVGTAQDARFDAQRITLPQALSQDSYLLLHYTKE